MSKTIKQIVVILALEALMVVVACGVVTITDPNNHIWSGTATFNNTATFSSAVTGTQPWSLALVTASNGFSSPSGMTLGSGGSGGNSSISCSNPFACLTITQGAHLSPAISVPVGQTNLDQLSVSGAVISFSGSTITMPNLPTNTGGQPVCWVTSGINVGLIYKGTGGLC